MGLGYVIVWMLAGLSLANLVTALVLFLSSDYGDDREERGRMLTGLGMDPGEDTRGFLARAAQIALAVVVILWGVIVAASHSPAGPEQAAQTVLFASQSAGIVFRWMAMGVLAYGGGWIVVALSKLLRKCWPRLHRWGKKVMERRQAEAKKRQAEYACSTEGILARARTGIDQALARGGKEMPDLRREAEALYDFLKLLLARREAIKGVTTRDDPDKVIEAEVRQVDSLFPESPLEEAGLTWFIDKLKHDGRILKKMGRALEETVELVLLVCDELPMMVEMEQTRSAIVTEHEVAEGMRSLYGTIPEAFNEQGEALDDVSSGRLIRKFRELVMGQLEPLPSPTEPEELPVSPQPPRRGEAA